LLDFLKFFVETATKILPSLVTRRRNQKLHEIGAELLLFYVQVNEALVRAEDIVGSLEVYVSRMKRHIEYGDDAYALTAGSWIGPKIDAQGQSLAKIGQTMRRWGIELQLLDGQMYAQLVRLLDEKAGALGMLLHVMTRRKLTLDLHAVLERSIESPGFQELIRRRELEQEMMKNAVSTTVEWGSDVYVEIARYLDERQPREQLLQIREALEEIRSAILSNFDVSELLLQVGDERFSGYRW